MIFPIIRQYTITFANGKIRAFGNVSMIASDVNYGNRNNAKKSQVAPLLTAKV